jgi:hypothetical protein
MTWLEQAACNGVDVDVFVVHIKPHNTGAAATHIKLAKALAICRQCPVIAECAAYMTTWPDPPRDIVIANLTPKEARRAWFAVNTVTHHHTRRTAS